MNIRNPLLSLIAAAVVLGFVLPPIGMGLALLPELGALPASIANDSDAQGYEAEDPEPGALSFNDNENDVSPTAGGPPGAYGPLANAVDIVQARFYGETGEFVRASIKVKDIKAEKDYSTILSGGGVDYFLCFKWGGKQYFAYAKIDHVTAVPRVGESHLDRAKGDCKIGMTFLDADRKFAGGLTVFIDSVESQIYFRINRSALNYLSEGSVPRPGDEFSGFWVLARDHRQPVAQTVNVLRFDQAPDAAPHATPLKLVYNTANQDLLMFPRVNVPGLACAGHRGLPTFAIEAGGKRGIPITVMNRLPAERAVNFKIINVEREDWHATMMPGIKVPPAAGDAPGNVTVNVIVDTPQGTKHKQCATFLVRAIDSQNSEAVGETTVNVVAVVPPTPERSRLYIHTGALASTVCTPGTVWMNAVSDDSSDAKKDVLFNNAGCSEVNDIVVPQLSLLPALLAVPVDVSANYDIIVNSSATGKLAKATLMLKSDLAPARAKITVVLSTLRPAAEALGEASNIVNLDSTAKAVKIDVPIRFKRDVFAEGDPSRIIYAQGAFQMQVFYEPQPLDDNVPLVKPAGSVYLVPQGSFLDLPIWEIRKTNVNEPGISGAFVSLTALTGLNVFANPGLTRVLNFTTLNEGATTDTVVVSTKITGGSPNWTAQAVPAGPFELAPGAAQRFAVGVVPPLDAKESETVRLEVVSSSQSDPTARGTTTVTIVATKGEAVPLEDLLPVDTGGKKDKGLPSLPAVLALSGLLAVAVWRRRRD